MLNGTNVYAKKMLLYSYALDVVFTVLHFQVLVKDDLVSI
jgi:hypothetical protein